MYSFIQRWFAPLKYGSSPLDRMRLGPSDGDRADLNPLMVRLVYPKDFLSSSRLPTVLLLLDPIFYMGCPPGRYFVVETFRK